ncbi:uncharacterized protein EDB93DRAFT_1164024 [Suillus bovinus]|uniref:uncharacterized protein n=1 Tax=Suillus bovinus TaxID=48563 RepID=UPI001B8801DF|nr:uncharacterized protein EDB93DRAFT_1164024 [Suillus bovinus]KAG2139079.1 hypothetical protein EDB93DRAFT_1164024 [Suillus bovinus]
MSTYLQRPELSGTIPQLTSSSPLSHAPDQDSMRSNLQSCLKYLDRVHDTMNCVHQEVLEIRTRITELLLTCQSEITMGGEGTLDSSMDFQAISDDEPQTVMPLAHDELNVVPPSLALPKLSISEEPLAFQGQFVDLKYDPLGLTRTLSEGLRDSKLPQDLLLSGTSGIVSHGLDVPVLLPEYDIYSAAKTLSESSTSQDKRHVPRSIAQGSQDRVNCSWPGCSRAVRKDNLTRHVNEMHRRKVKATCTGCGKGFARPYMLNEHICQA